MDTHSLFPKFETRCAIVSSLKASGESSPRRSNRTATTHPYPVSGVAKIDTSHKETTDTVLTLESWVILVVLSYCHCWLSLSIGLDYQLTPTKSWLDSLLLPLASLSFSNHWSSVNHWSFSNHWPSATEILCKNDHSCCLLLAGRQKASAIYSCHREIVTIYTKQQIINSSYLGLNTLQRSLYLRNTLLSPSL